MKFDEYTIGALGRGRVQIMFTEPITRDWEISLFMAFFEKHKKKITVSYQLKPNIMIHGIICRERTWSSFLKYIQRETIAIDFDKELKELDENEMMEYLRQIKQAGEKEQTRQLSRIKEIYGENKKNN